MPQTVFTAFSVVNPINLDYHSTKCCKNQVCSLTHPSLPGLMHNNQMTRILHIYKKLNLSFLHVGQKHL
ncbi:hypothetical protein CLOSTMETH_00389 [[Clostridium] methylpentosum DSM 5476]|uniref:Uncharacterized protein n=1 Tax=[Clostridium] methylpentosum DSM 5476 TaxID=537013 RepID=C0E991_9FIRM|nr:hypothetical protein CLOSTMETH_00389 [[Clostridium] methylpentosum DSM 5476]